jgi:hypothetical protein
MVCRRNWLDDHMVRKLPNLAGHLRRCVGANGLVSKIELGLTGRRKGV